MPASACVSAVVSPFDALARPLSPSLPHSSAATQQEARRDTARAYWPIAEWPINDRPREKLLNTGAAALSDSELLAVFLRTGLPGKSAVELARELLASFGSLSRLLAATPQELAAVRGVGNAKSAQLMAIVELTRRSLAEKLAVPHNLGSPGMVRDYLRLTVAHLPYEVFVCLFLDARNGLLAADQLFRGSLTRATVFPREVARQALHRNAAAVILAHNHPSGNPEPSQADVELTVALSRALALIDVQVLDHFVVGRDCAYSMAEHRQL
ncbi:DNA repair protein RadC [Cupriavidus sp. AU9028]|uniref:RadC family protein n=1 Tax=Cupriavidus sp. AU9028 TaxID=2871157 RepID=UPI001C977AFD|nr:DNA repair protein RadC [Cupriavidus sp. AU9028]MBY4897262.1 DNA repair protein RadC [Cupriavidus sp. AU9028]